MADLNEKLSPNFTLGELVYSETAERRTDLKAKQENPPQTVMDSLRYLATKTLQPIRDKFNFPIHITSGYRSEELNTLIGGVNTSQHVKGEAADCIVSDSFKTSGNTKTIRDEIESKIKSITGKQIIPDANPNFYLFAYICIHLNELDVDQVMHEYGNGNGKPAWVHVSSSTGRDRRQILSIGDQTGKKYVALSVQQALELGV